MAKHSSTWETLVAHPVLAAARLRRQEGAAVDPVLRLGLRARLADHDRPQGRPGRDAADRRAGPRALPPGLLDRRLPGRHAHPRRHARAKYKTGGARLALAMDVPILPVAHNAGWLWPKGVLGKRPGTITMTIGAPISAAGKDPAHAHAGSRGRGSRTRSRGSASRRARRGRRDATARRRDARAARDGAERAATRRRSPGQDGRLPAHSRAPAHDRHGGRPRRPHGARAALGDARRDRGRAARARDAGS